MPTDMEMDKRCPYCRSTRFRLEDGILRARVMPGDDGELDEEEGCLVYRCLSCGRGFDEIEAHGGPEPETSIF